MLRRLPFSSEIIGPPRGLVTCTEKWIETNRSKGASYLELIPGVEIKRKPPQCISNPIHWKFRREYAESRPAMFVVTIPQGRVWGNVGAVITPDDCLLGDVSREFLKSHRENSIFFQFKLARPKRIKGRVAVLATAGSRTYFHWMCDILPRFHLLRLAGLTDSIDYFVINSFQLPFQTETLHILGIPSTKILLSTNHWKFHIKADVLIVPSLPSKMDVVARWTCDFLRQSFLLAESKRTFTPNKLFVSRAKARNRTLTNEAEVFQLLSGYGFEMVYLEGMSVLDQARLFANARWVVAPHGAGLTNIVFCQPGTVIIDLFSPNWVNPCYWIISSELALNYYYLMGAGEPPPEYVDPIGQSDDIVVDLVELRELLEMAEIR